MNKLQGNTIWNLSTIALVLLVLIITFWGNSHNALPELLYIDEQITFFPIEKLLNPSSWGEFFWLAGDGNDYRYGRILWNFIAISASIPNFIWGNTGQIIAGREIQVFLLLATYLILLRTLIDSQVIRFFALVVLISAPYNSYYMSMPKIEPLMLFFAACFIYFYKKNGFILGSFYWIFCGLSFGAKISFLPAILIFIGISIFNLVQINNFKFFFKNISFTLLYIYLGFCIANPYFLPPTFFLLLPTSILIFIFYLFSLKNKYFYILVFFFLIFFIFTAVENLEFFNKLSTLIGFNHAIFQWTHATFLSINNSNTEILFRPKDWLDYLNLIWLQGNLFSSNLGPYFVYVCTYSLFFICILEIGGKILFKKIKISQDTLLLYSFFLIGIAFFALPIFSVKDRLWGMYAFPGSMFLICFLFGFADKSLLLKSNYQSKNFINKDYFEINIGLKIYQSAIKAVFEIQIFFILILILFISLLKWWPTFISDFIFLANHFPENELLERLRGM